MEKACLLEIFSGKILLIALVSCVELVLELGETSGESSFSTKLSGRLDKIYFCLSMLLSMSYNIAISYMMNSTFWLDE